MKSSRFQPVRRVEQSYFRDVLGIMQRYFALGVDVARVGFTTVPEWLEAYAKQAAERMVTHTYQSGFKTWREAAREAGQGPEIYLALQRELRGSVGRRYRELVALNAHYITSMPQEIASKLVVQMSQAQRAGTRPENLLKHLTRTKSALLARTETAKASAALTQARSESLGLQWYVWETSDDARVRRSHRLMQGVLFTFANPPSPELLTGEKGVGFYNAGNIFNCRCYMAPLLRFSQVMWPHKVYWDNAIRPMTLASFRNINSNTAALAA